MSIAQKLKEKLKTVEAGGELPPSAVVGAVPVQALDFGRPVFINPQAGPIEYLVSRGELEDGKDLPGMGRTRFHTALRFRDISDGAQVKAIKSVDWGNTGGGGASSAGDIRGYQLDCLQHLSVIRAAMPKPWLFEMLEAVVWKDEWLNLKVEDEPNRERRERQRKQRLLTIGTLYWTLDKAAVCLCYLEQEDFMRRWQGAPPKPTPAVRSRIRVSRA